MKMKFETTVTMELTLVEAANVYHALRLPAMLTELGHDMGDIVAEINLELDKEFDVWVMSKIADGMENVTADLDNAISDSFDVFASQFGNR
jgi:hypothetical protein